MSQPHENKIVRRSYTNGVLTAIAALLGVIVLQQTNSTGPQGAALAQVGVVGEQVPSEGAATGLISAAEQRKAIISELKTMNDRLTAIEGALAKGINVKVTSMPAQKAALEGSTSK
jgi:hypothetical protein